MIPYFCNDPVGIIKFGIPMLIPLLIKYAIDGVINNHALTTDEKVHHLTVPSLYSIIYFCNSETTKLNLYVNIWRNRQVIKYCMIYVKSYITIYKL